MIRRRRILSEILSDVPRIRPGTVIWENGVTGRDNLTILEKLSDGYGAWESGPSIVSDTVYDIYCQAQRTASSSTSGACIIGFGEPLDFSLCSCINYSYILRIKGDSYGAVVRMGVGTMPPSESEFRNSPQRYIPDEYGGWEHAVPNKSESYIGTHTCEFGTAVGIMLPMLSFRTAGSWSGGLLRPTKIWVE